MTHLHFTVWSTKATCIIYTQKYESPFVNVNYTIYNSTFLYVMHNRTGPKQEDKCRAESNNNSNDQRRKDNMTYILPGEGERTLLLFHPLLFSAIKNTIDNEMLKEY